MIRGDIAAFLGALGAAEGDPRLQKAIDLVGGEPTIESFDDDRTVETYLVLSDRGADLLLTDGALNTVFVYAGTTPDHAVYGGWSTLIEGVGPAAAPGDIVAALGRPLRSTDRYLTYAAEPGYVQFDFDSGALTMVTVMRELIGGDAPADMSPGGADVQTPDVQTPEPRAVDGEITVFLRAVGTPMFSPEHVAAIAQAGTAFESHDDERAGAQWEYDVFPSTGVTLQFKDEILVGALIALTGDDGPAYPSPAALIDGLPLPSTRAEVSARLGAPRLSDGDIDLYLVADRYVRFDFDAGRTSAVTVVLPGAEA